MDGNSTDTTSGVGTRINQMNGIPDNICFIFEDGVWYRFDFVAFSIYN
jgi:hypothetical protein